MATWKKIIVSGSDAHLKSVTASAGIIVTGSSLFSGSSFQVITSGNSTFSGSSFQVLTGNGSPDVNTGFQRLGFQSETQLSGSFTGSFTGIFQGPNGTGILSSSALSSPGQGQVTLTTNGIAQSATDLGLETTDSPQFVNLTLTGDINVNGGDIITNQTTFNIVPSTATTINVGTTDATAINFGKSGASTVTINDKLRVLGDLVVQGNVTELQVTNLNVEDQFVLLASGSQAVNVDGGIIVVSGSSAASGSALYHDTSARRWSFAQGVAASATSVTPNAYVGAIEEGSGTPSSAPALGDTGGTGTLYVQNNGDVWIYS